MFWRFQSAEDMVPSDLKSLQAFIIYTSLPFCLFYIFCIFNVISDLHRIVVYLCGVQYGFIRNMYTVYSSQIKDLNEKKENYKKWNIFPV